VPHSTWLPHPACFCALPPLSTGGGGAPPLCAPGQHADPYARCPYMQSGGWGTASGSGAPPGLLAPVVIHGGGGAPLPCGLPFAFCPCANPKGRGALLRVWACPPVHLPLWRVHGGWGAPLPRSLRSCVDPTCEPGKGGHCSMFQHAPGSLVRWARRWGGALPFHVPPPCSRIAPACEQGWGAKGQGGGGPKGGCPSRSHNPPPPPVAPPPPGFPRHPISCTWRTGEREGGHA